ncbi:MAG: hypothetical protein Q9175_005995 [Cornicularia normoerica]
MATYNWPSTGRERPKNFAEHATCLKVEFNLVSSTPDTSLSNTTLLPSGLKARISTGITKGIAEARSSGHCPKWSEIDKSIFSKVLLKNITTEAALDARDRSPLPQFNALRESYDALHTRLNTQIPPTATAHQFVGASAATEATSVVDLVSAAKKMNKETDLARPSKKIITIRQEEKVKDVNSEESRNDTDEGEEGETDEREDAGDGQEVMGSEVSESEEDSREDGFDDDDDDNDGSDSKEENEEASETESDAGSKEEENQDLVREESVPNIVGDGHGFTTTLNLEIQQQASVNQLEGITAPELWDYISSSLRKRLRKQQLSSRSVHISGITLLDNGDVKVVIHAETRRALQQIIGLAGWDRGFTPICSSVPSYNIKINQFDTKSLIFRNRKEKSAIIRELAGADHAIDNGNRVEPIISDIRWSKNSLRKRAAALTVEFLDPEQATQVLCASCGRGHQAGHKNCPAKAEARRSIGFVSGTTSHAIKPAAEGQATRSPRVRHSISAARTQTETSMPSPVSLDDILADDKIKSETDQSLPEADPTQDTYPDTATLLKQIEDLREVVKARDTALRNKSSGRTKRRAGEAFAGGAEAESSNMAAKRIKQEQPTREDSMGLYRQPSPYIVDRPQ